MEKTDQQGHVDKMATIDGDEAKESTFEFMRATLPSLYEYVGSTLRGEMPPDFLRRSCDGEAGIVIDADEQQDVALLERSRTDSMSFAAEELAITNLQQAPHVDNQDDSTDATIAVTSIADSASAPTVDRKATRQYVAPFLDDAPPKLPQSMRNSYLEEHAFQRVVQSQSIQHPSPVKSPVASPAYLEYNNVVQQEAEIAQQQQQQRELKRSNSQQQSASSQSSSSTQVPKDIADLLHRPQATTKQDKPGKQRDEIESNRLHLPATLNKKSDSCSWNERFQALQDRLFKHTASTEDTSILLGREKQSSLAALLASAAAASSSIPSSTSSSSSKAKGLSLSASSSASASALVRKASSHYVCTYAKSGANFIEQRVFECRSCGLVDGDCCCAACAIVCHPAPQHDCSFTHYSLQAYCDCGASGHCKALPTEPIAEQNETESADLSDEVLHADSDVPVTQQERLISILNLYSSIGNLYKEFLRTARLYAKLIISEKYSETKTVEPVDVGGLVGGRKYIAEGILFKFAYDVVVPGGTIYNGDSNAMKSAGHELKSLNAIQQLNIPGLCFPLMCVIDYRGFRVTAMSVLPISKQSLIYGSADAGITVVGLDRQMNKSMALVGRRLNLRTHIAGCLLTKYIGMPGDIEGHLGGDQRFYVIDFARLFPPEPPTSQGTFLYRLLRQELVSQSPIPLCADAFSAFQMNDPSRNQWNIDVCAAYRWLLKEKVVEFARWLEGVDRTETLEDKERINITVEMHKMGINVRFLGPLYEALASLYWRERVMTEMVVRVAKCTLRVFLRRTMARIHLASEEPYICVAVDFLNLLLGLSAESLSYWSGSLRRSINGSFFYHKDCQKRSKREQLRTQIHILRLLEETLARTGVKLQPWVVVINNHPVMPMGSNMNEPLSATHTGLSENDAGLHARLAKIRRQNGGRLKKITKKLLRQEQPFEERDVESVQPKIKAMRLLDSIAPFNCYKSFLLSDDPADIDDCIASFEARHDPHNCTYFHAFVWAKAYFQHWRFSGGLLEQDIEKAVSLVSKVAFRPTDLEAALNFDINFFEVLREEADRFLEEAIQHLQQVFGRSAHHQPLGIDSVYLFKAASLSYQGLAIVHAKLQDLVHFGDMLQHVAARIKQHPKLNLGSRLDFSPKKDIAQTLSWIYHNSIFRN